MSKWKWKCQNFKMEIRKHLELNESKTITYQNCGLQLNQCLTGKFIILNTVSEKKEGLKDLSFCLKILKRKGKFKISQCKEIINSRVESMNQKKAMERSMLRE